MAVVGVRERKEVSEWRKVSLQVRDQATEENKRRNEKRGQNKLYKQRRNNNKGNEWDW